MYASMKRETPHLPCRAQVVPPRERSQVYAFDRCIGGFVGALSNVIVPLLAEYVFHYRKDHDPRPEGHQNEVRAPACDRPPARA